MEGQVGVLGEEEDEALAYGAGGSKDAWIQLGQMNMTEE